MRIKEFMMTNVVIGFKRYLDCRRQKVLGEGHPHYAGKQEVEMMGLSLRIVVLCLVVSLGAAIGIGHIIEGRQIDALSSQIAEQEELISVLRSEAEQRQEHVSTLESETRRLTAETATLALDIAKKQASYDSLLAKHSSAVEELQTLRASFSSLSQEYQTLLDKHEALKEAGNGVLVEELNRLREQITFAERQISLRDIEIGQLREQVSLLERQNGLLHIQVAQLTEQVTPAPHHAVAGRDIWGRPEFKSIAWTGRDRALHSKIEEIAHTFHRTHTFIEGEMDCNDMAVSLWNMLLTEGIKSVIVIGNLDIVEETLAESNHAWLYVFNARGEVIYLEPTTGEMFFGILPDGSTNPRSIPYREGFIYVRPSDLRRDLKDLW